MSLDFSLTAKRTVEIFSANITHNLTAMAEAAGVYLPLWRPAEIGIRYASEMVGHLEEGLAKLKAEPMKFEMLNSPNGWGMYENFVPFVEQCLEACRANPDAEVEACI